LGANEKLCIWELWGRSLRVPGSPAIALVIGSIPLPVTPGGKHN
jgi:hypothetical protein